MRILILTASNPYKTAGIVALDIKKALTSERETEVLILTKSWDGYEDKTVISLHSKQEELIKKLLRLPLRIRNKLMRTLFNYSPSNRTDINYSVQGLDLTSDYYPTKRFLNKINTFKPNAIIVLFMQQFLTFKNLYELNKATQAPILLYMMDMAPMTGGCHYAWDCKGYMKQCGMCPAYNSDKENDLSRKNWKFKKEYVEKTDISIIAGTEYQYQQLLKSSLFQNKNKHKSLLSINPEIFKPGDKNVARAHLKLPVDKKIIFFGAGNISSKRKGIKELINALDILYYTKSSSTEIHLAIAGGGAEIITNKLKFTYSLLGKLNHAELAKVFQASDLFLCPSIEDSGPMMINQSIMCGTPVVSFDMGVAQDLVITGETGYRATLGDANDLAKGIEFVLQLNEQQRIILSNNCIHLSNQFIHPDVQTNRFNEIIKSHLQMQQKEFNKI